MRNVIVCGKGTLAIKICRWFQESSEYSLRYVVPDIPEPKWTDSLSEFAVANGIPIVSTGRYQDIPDLPDPTFPVDLCLSVFHKRIFRPDFIARCGRILNIHLAPLPKYRGVRSINWALKNREAKHGVTLHEVTAGVDAGPIVAQAEFSIYPEFDEVKDVYDRALTFAYALFVETMPILDRITPRPQDESAATQYFERDSVKLGEFYTFSKAQSKDVLGTDKNT